MLHVVAIAHLSAMTDPVPLLRSVDAPAVVESFDAYYQRDYRRLLGFAYVLTGDQWQAEDLVQDAMAEAAKRWDTIGAYDDPAGWVRRVLVNRRTSKLRRFRTETKGLARLRSVRQSDVAPTERTLEVWESVRKLPKRQAEVIALYYWEDRSLQQIADILDCGTETVKTHLKRGRKALAADLSHFQGTEDDHES